MASYPPAQDKSLRICYFLAQYISHRKAGLFYKKCLSGLGVDLVDEAFSADVVVIHDEPWTYPTYYRAMPYLKEKYVIAYAVWESDKLPPRFRAALELVQEIWTPSHYCLDIFKDVSDRVFVVPHVVPEASASEKAMQCLRSHIKFDDALFYLYTISSALDVRKNLRAALRAFASLSAKTDLRFIVKTTDGYSGDMIRIPSVIVIDQFLNDDEIQALHEIGKCFVSPHCSEGWGMGIAEAMGQGNLAVATGYGGNMDYMRPGNSLPVRYTVEPIREMDYRTRPALWSPHMHWAYVDEVHLRESLEFLVSEWNQTSELRARARVDMKRYSADEVAKVIRQRLLSFTSFGRG